MNDLELVCTEEELNKVISYIDKSFNTIKNSDRQFDNITNLANFLKKNNIRLGAIECEKILDSSNKINETFYTLYLAETLLRVNKFPELVNLVQLYSIRTGNELEKDIDHKMYGDSRDGNDIDLIKLYLNEIGDYSILTKEEELELINQGEEGRRKLCEHNLKLVVSIAKTYRGNGLPLGDLIQYGNEGLVVASKKFDSNKGCKFSTYATYWVKQCITRGIADRSRTIRIPVHIHENIIRMKKAINLYKMQNGGYGPNNEELAKMLDLSVEKIEIAKKCMDITVSLSTPVGGGEDGTDTELGELIEDERLNFDNTMDDMMIRDFMSKFMSTTRISERDKKILMLRNGFYNNKKYTLEEIGAMYGVTRERIRQIELHALRKLQKDIVIGSFDPKFDVMCDAEVAHARKLLKGYNDVYDDGIYFGGYRR